MKRHQVIPAVHLFLIKDNQVLLLRRFQTGYEDGNYSVPAGHIDQGEQAIESVIREAKEEVDIDLIPDQLEFIHVMNRAKDGEERIDFFFVARDWTGKLKVAEPDKCDQIKWFKFNDLPDNVIDYIDFALEKFKNKEMYSYFGF